MVWDYVEYSDLKFYCQYDISVTENRWKIDHYNEGTDGLITGNLKRAIIKQAIQQEPFKSELEKAKMQDPISLGTLPLTLPPYPVWDICNAQQKQEEKEHTMRSYNDCVATAAPCINFTAPAEYSPEKTKVDYLSKRLWHARDQKDTELMRAFHLVDDESPTTFVEWLDRIKAGKFVAPKDWDWFQASEVGYRLSWRDPAVPADKTGYAAASKLMKAAYEAARDTIIIGTPEAGLKALQEFEAQSFTVN